MGQNPDEAYLGLKNTLLYVGLKRLWVHVEERQRRILDVEALRVKRKWTNDQDGCFSQGSNFWIIDNPSHKATFVMSNFWHEFSVVIFWARNCLAIRMGGLGLLEWRGKDWKEGRLSVTNSFFHRLPRFNGCVRLEGGISCFSTWESRANVKTNSV